MPALFGECDGAAPFLKQLTSLQHLELELRCLEPHLSSIEDGGPPPMPAIRPAVKLAFTDVPDPAPVYNLADILPSSLKSLRLVGTGEPDEHAFMQSLLAGIQTRREQDLPSFERLEICRPQPSLQSESDGSEAAKWLTLADMLPSTIEYSYSEADPAEAAWLAEFYPHTREDAG